MNYSHEYQEADWNTQYIWESAADTAQDSMTSAGRGFVDAFTKERRSLRDRESSQATERDTFRRRQAEQWRSFHAQKQEWEDSETRARELFVPEHDILQVDIGGQGCIAVARSTLCRFQESALAAMFSGRHTLVTHNGAIFIDRDFQPFASVVSFLRTGRRPKTGEAEFRAEMDYWGIPLDPPATPTPVPKPRVFDRRLSSDSLTFDGDLQTARKTGIAHAALFTALKLSAADSFLEFHVSATSQSEDGCELQLGLVDVTMLPAKLTPTLLWPQVANAFFWDICDSKLIRTDERRKPTECEGYSCCCYGEDSTFGVLYDERHRSVSFFKDGIAQGVAFSCVAPGLTPVLDLWFPSGEVRVLQSVQPTPRFD